MEDVVKEDVIKNLCKFILDNLYNDINMERLENEFYYNRFYLIRIFKQYTGYTIKEYINTVKILETINPLVSTNDTILKIALTNGFNSQEYYSEKFQQIIGTSPLRFRKEFKEIDSSVDIKTLKSKKQYLLYLKQHYEQLTSIPYELEKKEKVKRLAA